jgi:broad specificity phosphatase PhoE
MILYALRHGHSDYNRLGLCNDDPRRPVHLTELGRRQARQAAARLRDVSLERVFSSELPRALETAAIVAAPHGLTPQPCPALNDIRSGFDGRPVTDYFAAVGADRLRLRVNGGESLLDYKARVLPFLERLRHRPWQRVLLVAHEETLRVLQAWHQGLPDQALEGLSFGNCELLEFEFDPDSLHRPRL